MKKFLEPLLYLTIIILIISSIVIAVHKKTSKPVTSLANESTNTTYLNVIKQDKDEYKSNYSGENAVIYLGTHSYYDSFTIILNRNLKQEDLARTLIEKISKLISYKIEINSIRFEDNNIYVDFSKNGAPFETEKSYIETEDKIFSLYGADNLTYTIFDSIYTNFQVYFGTDKNIYYSCDSENINLNANGIKFNINKSEPYILEE